MNPAAINARRELSRAIELGRVALRLRLWFGYPLEATDQVRRRALNHLSAARAWRTGDPRLPMVGGAR